MLDYFDNTTLDKIDNILDSIVFPQKQNWDVAKYCSFSCKEQLPIMQWLNPLEYIDALEEIYEFEKYDKLSALIPSFIPNRYMETFLKMIQLLEMENSDQSSIYKNFIIDYYHHTYRNDNLVDLKSNIENKKITTMKDVKFFNVGGFFGISENIQKDLNSAIKDDKILDFSNSTFGDHILYTTVFSFIIVRNVIYKNLNRHIINKVLDNLKQTKDFYFKLLEENKILPNSAQRLSSLISCYYEIQIKLDMEENGNKSAKKHINAYLSDMLFFEKHVEQHIVITDRKKTFINFIEIAYFYKYMRVSDNDIIINGERFYIKDYYYQKVMKSIHDINFINTQREYYFKHSLVFGLLPILFHSISEIGLFITSLNIFDNIPETQNSHLTKSFFNFFEEYRLQNYDHAFMKEIKFNTPFGYIWE